MAPIEALWKQTLGVAADWDSLSSEDSFKPPSETLASEAAATEDATRVGEEGFVALAELGRGGMGTVYRARQARLRRTVALKKMRARGPGKAAAFTTEALLCASLEHPNIVPIYDLAGSEDELSLAMKLIEGESWRQRLAREPDAREAHLEILLQLCNAVSFAHSRGVVHNDIKPANVMLGAYGEVLLVDWGLAAELGARPGPLLRPAARLSAPCGTPCYMPPELARGDGAAVGPWTDTYLLGAVLYHILHGRPPRTGAFRIAVEDAAAGRFRPIDPGLPDELRAVCARALAPAPEERYATAAALREDLVAWLRHRESAQISAAARAQLAAVEAGAESAYRGYAEALAGFRHALSLWAANPGAHEGRRRAHRAFATAALARGDLGLAASQAEQLGAEAGAEGDALRASIEAARRDLAARERARKVQRRLLRGAGLALLVGLLVALSVFGWQYAVIAVRNEEIRGHLAEIRLQKQEADSARARAETRGTVAQQALADLVYNIKSSLIDQSRDPATLATAERLLDQVRVSMRRLAQTEIGGGGLSQIAAEALLQVAELRVRAGAPAEDCLRELDACRALLASLAEEYPDPALRARLTTCDVQRAQVLARESRYDEGRALLEDALAQLPPARDPAEALLLRTRVDALCALSSNRRASGALEAALRHATTAVAAAETLQLWLPQAAEAAAPLVSALSERAQALRRTGRVTEACADATRLLALQESLWAGAAGRPGQALALIRACLLEGQLRRELGRDDAETPFLRAKQLADLLLESAPYDAELQDAWARCVDNLAALYGSRHDFAQARPLLAENVATRRRLALLAGGSPGATRALAEALVRRAQAAKLREPAAAEEDLAEARRLVLSLDTTGVLVRELWQDIESEHCELLRTAGSTREALEHGRRAVRLAEERCAREPQSSHAARVLAVALGRCALAAEELGRADQALAWMEASHGLQVDRLALAPDDRTAQRDLAASFGALGRVRGVAQGPAAALPCFEEAFARFAALAEDDEPLRVHAFDALLALVRHAAEAEQPARGEEHRERLEAWLPEGPLPPALAARYTRALTALGDAWMRAGAPEAAGDSYATVCALAEAQLARRPEDATLLRERSVCAGRLGDARWAAGAHEAAAEAYAVAVDAQRALLVLDPGDFTIRYELCFYLHKLTQATPGLPAPRALADEELGLMRGLFEQLPDHPLIRKVRIAALEQAFNVRVAADEREEARDFAAEIAACLAEDGNTAALERFRARLANDPALAWLREREDFAEWWEALPE